MSKVKGTVHAYFFDATNAHDGTQSEGPLPHAAARIVDAFPDQRQEN
jgi:hypothetical protein